MNMFKRVLTIVLAIAILSSNIVFAAESAMGSATQDSGSPSNEQGTDLPTIDPSVVGDPTPTVDPSVVGDPPPAVDPSVVGDPPPAVDPSVVGDPTTPPAVDQEGTLLRYTEQVTMHTVTFRANVGGTIGGEKTATRLVQDGEALGEGNLPEPTPDEGAYFETWKRGGMLLPSVEVSYIENEKVTKDITYIAFFKKYLKLRYDTNGGEGTVTDDHEYMPNDVASISEAVPTRAKAIFLGWSTKKHELITTGTEADEVKSTLAIDTVTLATDVTLFAVWVEDTNGGVFPDYNQSTVTFVADEGGKLIGELTSKVNPGDPLVEDAIPEAVADDGWYFLGWHTGDNTAPIALEFMLTSPVMADTTFTAKFLKSLELIYDTNGGEGTVTDDHEYMPNDVASISEAVPTRAKAIFLGWSTKKHELITTGTEADEVKSTLVIDTVTLATDVTLYAVWAADANGDGVPDYNQSRPSPTTTPDEPSSPDPTDTPTTVAPVVAPVAPVISVAVAPVTPVAATPDVTPDVTPAVTPDVTPATINTEDSVNISAVPDEEIALANAALGGQGPYGILSLVVVALTLATAFAMHRGKQKKHE